MFVQLCYGTLPTTLGINGPAIGGVVLLSLTTLIMVPATGMLLLALSPKLPTLAFQMESFISPGAAKFLMGLQL